MSLLGIDVSHHQGEVNWHSVARSNVKFAFCKATEGNTFVDSHFARNWEQIQDVGLYRGAYHFGRPGSDPETQAIHFASTVGHLGFGDLPPVLDIEVDDGHPAKHVLDWSRSFVQKAEALLGRKLIIYTGAFWRGPLKNPNDAFFAARDLWLAAYRKNPVVPASWQKYTFWQFTEGTHNDPRPIQGVRPCDQNLFDGDEAALKALCSPTAAPPAVVVPEEHPQAAFGGTSFVWPRTPAMSGGAIRQWQMRMLELGFSLDQDGVYGPQSKAVCIAFQRDNGLSADGIVGPRTWAACFAT